MSFDPVRERFTVLSAHDARDVHARNRFREEWCNLDFELTCSLLLVWVLGPGLEADGRRLPKKWDQTVGRQVIMRAHI